MLYLQTFTEAAIVCDCTVILETIPIVIFEKRRICQCGSYPFTDCWGLKHENRFKPFTAFWISKQDHFGLYHTRRDATGFSNLGGLAVMWWA